MQVQAIRVINEKKYLDHTSLEMATYLDRLQKPDGLFYQAPDGRCGDGCIAAVMTELLRNLPIDHPKRERIMDGYRKMMVSLLKYQNQNGMWH